MAIVIRLLKASLENAEELQLIKYAVEQSCTCDVGLKKVYEELGLAENIYVVHGTAVPTDGLDKGRIIPHAWIEVGHHAIETSNGQRIGYPVSVYYEKHSISPKKRYTVSEARALADKYGF